MMNDLFFIYIYIIRGVWVSLHVPQLIFGFTEHHASSINR
jgi:hypothetical protein